MKIAESWLREWVNPELDTEALGHQLTMLGHEVDGISIEGAGLDGVVVAEVVEFGKHPDADRLSVCKVSNGDGDSGSCRAEPERTTAPSGITDERPGFFPHAAARETS